MKNKAQLIAAFAASVSLATLASAQTALYLNRAQAVTNNALSSVNSWWTDAAGTTANTAAVGSPTNILTFNNLVTTAFTGRTGGGTGGSLSIGGFQILDPAGSITVTAGNSNLTQTVTIAAATGIDMSAATQDFTFKSGSTTGAANLRLSSALTAYTWKVQSGRTLTIGDLTNGTTTTVTSQTTGRTLNLTGNGTTGLGNVIFNGNVINTLAVAIDGTGSNSSGGNIAFNGSANTLSTLTIKNAVTTFVSGGTTAGTVTVNSGGVLSMTGTGNATLSGATTVNGQLRPNSTPSNSTSRFNFSNALTLASASTTTFDLDGANYTGVSSTGATTFSGSLNLNLLNTLPVGSYSYNLFDFGSQSGAFTSIGITSIGSLVRDGASNGLGTWSGAFGSNSFQFTESDGILGITVSAIPEPSTWAALAGLSGMAFAAGRRRRRAA